MTSKEALERLKFIVDKELNTGSKSYDDLQEFWNYEEPLKVIEKLVERDTSERDTPKKVIKEVDTYEFYERDIYRCGSCKKVLIIDEHKNLQDNQKTNYCYYCGQRIDWSK